MPAIQPAELWQESGRWDEYRPRLCCASRTATSATSASGPTHEEVITDIARRELKSYRQLPVNFYQIQTKFRDEIRPRFGVMRAREFIMKDAYSFHMDEASLRARLRRDVRRLHAHLHAHGPAVPRRRGGHRRHRRQTGRRSSRCWRSRARTRSRSRTRTTTPRTSRPRSPCRPRRRAPPPSEALKKVPTPGVKTIDDLCKFLNVPAAKTVKTLVYEGKDGLVALLLRGDQQLNEVKASRLPQIQLPLRQASEAQVRSAFGAGFGSLGPLFARQGAGARHVHRGPLGRGDGGLRRRRERGRQALRRRELGPRPARSPRTWRTCATSSKATRARRAKGGSRSCAASRWATSSSSAANTARP